MSVVARALVFTHNGSVELRGVQDRVLWSSRSVPAFTNEFGTFVQVDESETILEWLVEQGIVSENTADRLDIEEESLTDDDEDEDEDDDDVIADDDGDES